MNVNPSMIKQALHRVIRQRRMKAGSWTTLTDLRRNWSVTGLRSEDLIDGLDMLSKGRYVSLQDDGADCIITLIRHQNILQSVALAETWALSEISKRLHFGLSSFERRKSPVSTELKTTV